MCGIAGYFGEKRSPQEVLLSILEKLEYRGYDSAGLAYKCLDGKIVFKKEKGELAKLKAKLKQNPCKGGAGIAHTRWATHGKPSPKNAHPHKAEELFLVHNGIIENYKELKQELQENGIKFESDTDTEVALKLIWHLKNKHKLHTKDAFLKALAKIEGAYAFVLFDSNSFELFATRLSSPLVVAIKEEKQDRQKQTEFFLASDALAVLQFSNRVIYLNDYDFVHINHAGYHIENLKNKKVAKEEFLDLQKQAVSKEGFKHFMLKEIYEQPESILQSISGRIDKQNLRAVLGGLKNVEQELKQAEEIHFIASGTSYNASELARYAFEELAEVKTQSFFGSEARYSKTKPNPKRIAIFVSQSGETADTLAALEKYKKEGYLCLGVVNVVSSSIARKTHAGVYNHAGPEISVASTKAFSSQLAVLFLIAAKIAELKGINEQKRKRLLKNLLSIPKQLEKTIKEKDNQCKKIASKIKSAKSMYFLARTWLYPLAEEGALKAKEISYIHAESYHAGELKHGPLALVEKDFPTVFLLPKNKTLFEKTLSNAEETKARGAKLVFIGPDAQSFKSSAQKLSSNYIELPLKNDFTDAILFAVPLQLLAYHLAVSLNLNPDKPRNLAKSVTVE